MWEAIIYLVVAVITALYIAAYEPRWGVWKSVFLGVTWPVSLLIIAFIVIKRKIKGR